MCGKVRISLVEVYESGVGTSVTLVCKKAQKVLHMHFYGYKKVDKTFWFQVYSYLKESAFTAGKRDKISLNRR